MNFLRLIESKGYITVSKELARNLGLDETLILTELISKYNHWKDKGKLTEEGYFYITIKDLKHETTLTKYRQTKAINNLKDMGLIKTKKQGLPAKRYFTICKNEIKRLFFDIENKNLKNTDNPRNDQEVKNSKTRECKSGKLSGENSPQLRTNNKSNKTEEEDARARGEKLENKKIPDKVQQKFQQIFNRELSQEMYNKLIKYFTGEDILLKALETAELNADKPSYLLKVLKDWKDKGLSTVKEIITYLEKRKSDITRNYNKGSSNKTTGRQDLDELYAKGYK